MAAAAVTNLSLRSCRAPTQGDSPPMRLAQLVQHVKCSSRHVVQPAGRTAAGSTLSQQRRPQRPFLCCAADGDASELEDAADDTEEELSDPELPDAELEQSSNQDDGLPVLRIRDQIGLRHWEPAIPTEPEQQGVAAAGQASVAAEQSGGGRPTYQELLQRLPGLQRQLRAAAQERVGLPAQEEAEEAAGSFLPSTLKRYPRDPEPELSEWDLRAKMEKRQRQQKEYEDWMERRSRIGEYPSLGVDWRVDVRLQDGTGNPTDPEYREWTHKEIWDLITNHGRNADPREVEVWVRNPLEIADAPAQGAKYCPTPEEYFESLGKLIREDELETIQRDAKGDAEGALLASEFSDFDDELVGAANFDADYTAGEEDEDGF